jgi:hypothetical protein
MQHLADREREPIPRGRLCAKLPAAGLRQPGSSSAGPNESPVSGADATVIGTSRDVTTPARDIYLLRRRQPN